MIRKAVLALGTAAALAISVPAVANAQPHWGWHHRYFGGPRFSFGFGFGAPVYAYAAPYPVYGCWRESRVWTPFGWRWHRVWVC